MDGPNGANFTATAAAPYEFVPEPVTCAMVKMWMAAAKGPGWVLNCDDYANGLAINNNFFKETLDKATGLMIKVTDDDGHGTWDNCESGWLLLPGTNTYSRGLVAGTMLVFLLWSFLGINIVADVFMSSIEVITAVERESKRKGLDGDDIVVKTKIWNPTVANLSLMALGKPCRLCQNTRQMLDGSIATTSTMRVFAADSLTRHNSLATGSSAPEIMLALLDTIQTLGKPPGELGPSTIVGSAAFNLFVISAVCVTALPLGETKKIEQTTVQPTAAAPPHASLPVSRFRRICFEMLPKTHCGGWWGGGLLGRFRSSE